MGTILTRSVLYACEMFFNLVSILPCVSSDGHKTDNDFDLRDTITNATFHGYRSDIILTVPIDRWGIASTCIFAITIRKRYQFHRSPFGSLTRHTGVNDWSGAL